MSFYFRAANVPKMIYMGYGTLGDRFKKELPIQEKGAAFHTDWACDIFPKAQHTQAHSVASWTPSKVSVGRGVSKKVARQSQKVELDNIAVSPAGAVNTTCPLPGKLLKCLMSFVWSCNSSLGWH